MRRFLCAVSALLEAPHPPFRPQTPASPRISGLFLSGLLRRSRARCPRNLFGDCGRGPEGSPRDMVTWGFRRGPEGSPRDMVTWGFPRGVGDPQRTSAQPTPCCIYFHHTILKRRPSVALVRYYKFYCSASASFFALSSNIVLSIFFSLYRKKRTAPMRQAPVAMNATVRYCPVVTISSPDSESFFAVTDV